MKDKTVPQNLLKIPGYFFFNANPQPLTLSRQYEDLALQCNLDIALLTFSNFLEKIHSDFFDDFEEK